MAQEKIRFRPFLEIPNIIFLFSLMLTIGSFAANFLIAYFTYDDQLFRERLQIYYHFNIYIWIWGFIVLSIALFIRRSRWQHPYFPSAERPLFQDDMAAYSIFLLALGLALLSNFLYSPLHLLDFITFIIAVYTLLLVARNYTFQQLRPAWQHPTNAGAIVQGTVVMGCAMGLALFLDETISRILAWTMLVFLILEGLTIWSRFRFLSSANVVTRQAVQMMLGTHVTLFGVRFIFGIIMPAVYLIWGLFFAEISFNPVILMVLVGELSGRILFFITAQPYSAPTNGHPLES
ncbi:MAG: hypothetical protein WAN36_03290 [Calditrichia bacterium]